MNRTIFGFALLIIPGVIAYGFTNSIVIGLMVSAISLVLLPPSIDPAIQIKESQFGSSLPSERRDVAAVNAGKCPDCGASALLAGPSGGMSQNVLCNSCLMEFNIHSGFGTGAFKVDHTGKADVGRAGVFGVQPDEYNSIVS